MLIRFGTEGIVYGLFGSGAELFTVDNRTGVITVAFCATPGEQPCLDFETQPDFFLNYKVKKNVNKYFICIKIITEIFL